MMTGFVTDPNTAAAVLDAIREAQVSRGQPHYWSAGSMPIYSAPHAGKAFIPASDELLDTPLRQGLTPRDFPEFNELIELLGGLDARQEVSPEDLINPDQEQ